MTTTKTVVTKTGQTKTGNHRGKVTNPNRDTKLAQLLVTARLAKNFTLMQVASSLDKSMSSITNWENGRAFPICHEVYGICKLLDIHPVELIKAAYEDAQAQG